MITEISVPLAAKIIGCDPQALRKSIDNGTFEYGIRYQPDKKKRPSYSVAWLPLKKIYGLTDEDLNIIKYNR